MSTQNTADIPVLQVQLDTVNQEITYNGTSKVIPESYWKDTLLPFLYPLWDSDKDKLILFNWFTNDTYYAKRRRHKKNFSTGEYEWVDYEMEQLAGDEGKAVKDKLVEAYYLIDSLEEQEFNQELARMYAKTASVSPLTIRLSRNFLLDETDWAMTSDSPLTDDEKAKYITYRQKLRDITDQPEFSTDAESVKFPISPEFYNKIYLQDNPGVEYLATDDQMLPLARHQLKLFRDKIANYLVIKSITETNYFNALLTEYETVKNARESNQVEDAFTPEQIAERKLFLEELLKKVQDELDEEAS
tara:strand:+ start:11421 stop:12326 length:906 start_codon:yes stop_codon:yes gene_type:complete